MFTNLLFYTSIIGFFSCSTVEDKDVNDDKIYQAYTANFDADEGKLKLYAQFKLGGGLGTAIQLTEPAKIEVNSSKLELNSPEENIVNKIYGAFYKKYTTTVAPSYLFKWTLADGSIKENKIDAANKVEIKDLKENQEINKLEKLELKYTGQANGNVSCNIGSLEKKQDMANHVSVKGTENKCVFSINDLNSLPQGKFIVQVTNTIRTKTQASTEIEGTMTSGYQSKSIKIIIK